jgi:hypothetical protein
MTDRVSWAVLLLCANVAAAGAQTPALAPPLSQYGPLHAPRLQTHSLQPDVRGAVETALTQSAAASTKAMEAEAVMRQARHAAGEGREAAHRAERAGRGGMPVSFDHMRCRYSGDSRNRRAHGFGVMTCGPVTFEGQFRDGAPAGLTAMEGPGGGYVGQYRDGRRDGLGGDYARGNADAYEGEYRDGARMGLGIERDKDGFYPGQYGFYTGPDGKRTNMELAGTQDFRESHWAGAYGAYSGPKIVCRLIRGAVLEGSVLDGVGAKFDARGRAIEQGRYRLGILENGKGPPC